MIVKMVINTRTYKIIQMRMIVVIFLVMIISNFMINFIFFIVAFIVFWYDNIY